MLYQEDKYHRIEDVFDINGFSTSNETEHLEQGLWLVACGYTQIPGVDFTEAYSPVINDVVFRIMIVLQMVWHLNAKIIDVKTAFLH